MKIRAWQSALAATVVLSGALLVQHQRHGWPFSLHHGVAAPPAPPAAAPREPQARVEVSVDPGRLAGLGITTAAAAQERLSEPLRTVATVVPDESRISHVHTRVSGWLEQVHVASSGEAVAEGQPLATIFSQELLASQVEYLDVRRALASGPPTAAIAAARERLRVLGMAAEDIAHIERLGEPRRLVTITAPRSGVVLRRGVSAGTAVDASTELFAIADLSRVWIVAEVPEMDSRRIAQGTRARLDFPASGRRAFDGAVEFVYPALSERTRTLRIRFAVPNPGGALRPGMYGTAEFATAPRESIVVARDAVVDTGRSQHVFVVASPGVFVPRPVVLGRRVADRVEVLEGVAAGETVVTSGVFLIDSESRLRASGGAGTGHAHGATQEDHAGHETAP